MDVALFMANAADSDDRYSLTSIRYLLPPPFGMSIGASPTMGGFVGSRKIDAGDIPPCCGPNIPVATQPETSAAVLASFSGIMVPE